MALPRIGIKKQGDIWVAYCESLGLMHEAETKQESIDTVRNAIEEQHKKPEPPARKSRRGGHRDSL